MNHQRQFYRLIVVILLTLTLPACATNATEEDSVADSVAHTLTAAASPMDESPPEATEEFFPGDLQPLSSEECEQIAAFMVNRLFVPPVEQEIVPVQREGEAGGGCKAIGVTTGQAIPDMITLEDAMRGILAELGWTETPTAAACLGTGGWGPGANSTCFTQEDGICELFVHVDPASDDLCSGDEPITVCFERLAPEQIVYTVELTCTRDASPAARPLESELMRIEFEPGAIQTLVYGDVAAGGIDHYVLTALEGQTMTLNLWDRADEMIATDTAVLVIWGADGTVLISNHADAVTWSGDLPSTQDYFVDVLSVSDQHMPYTLEIVIPPP
jgi:hypothetical protein